MAQEDLINYLIGNKEELIAFPPTEKIKFLTEIAVPWTFRAYILSLILNL